MELSDILLLAALLLVLVYLGWDFIRWRRTMRDWREHDAQFRELIERWQRQDREG